MLVFKAPTNALSSPISTRLTPAVATGGWHILIIWLGYALFYFTRKALTPAAPAILASGILSRSDIGLLSAVLHHLRGVEICLRHR